MPGYEVTQASRLHCPRCGAELQANREGELECRAGNMQLSIELNRRLTECYITKVREPAPSPLSSPIGGIWFCPGCACTIPEENREIYTVRAAGSNPWSSSTRWSSFILTVDPRAT